MTDKIEKILIPLDGSQNSIRGLEKAISLAQPLGATITGLYVIHVPAKSAIRMTPEQRKKEISFAESIIEKAKAKVENNGIRFNVKTETGNPGEQIIRVAKNGKYDLIVIGSRGRGSAKEMFLGSVSNYVLHKADMPVMVVK